MSWFKKKEEYTVLRPKPLTKKVEIPEGMWTRCDECQTILYNKDLEANLKVCTKCGFHFKLKPEERLRIILDEGSYQAEDTNLRSIDPLKFPGYQKKLDALKAQGKTEEIYCGVGTIDGIPVSIVVMDFSFIGGSMGSVVGEKVTRAIERGIENRLPVVIFSQTGGARMHEGILSLMQMAKTSCALKELHKARIPYISVLTDPSTAGVMASYASLGDVIIAEPKAYIGFAGARVIEQTIHQPLPPGFQRSEFLLKHGILDMVVDRRELKKTLSSIIGMLAQQNCSVPERHLNVTAPTESEDTEFQVEDD